MNAIRKYHIGHLAGAFFAGVIIAVLLLRLGGAFTV